MRRFLTILTLAVAGMIAAQAANIGCTPQCGDNCGFIR